MKMIEAGTNMNGDPVYNVANDDGKLVTTTIMTQAEATAMIEGSSVNETVVVSGIDTAMDTPPAPVPDYKVMTKLELEVMMRTHGIELDRRKSKSDLVKEVKSFFEEK